MCEFSFLRTIKEKYMKMEQLSGIGDKQIVVYFMIRYHNFCFFLIL